MNRRLLLVALLLASTAALVVGVSIERSSGDSHDEPVAAADLTEPAESGEEHAADGAEERASETGPEARTEEAGADADEDEDERVLGVDLEATPFIVLAAAFSLGLALAARLRPEWRRLLALVTAAMVVFAVLDGREVVHQLAEDNHALAVLAGVVAALHLAAAAVALSIGRSPGVAQREPLA